jgi:hypothetical protein
VAGAREVAEVARQMNDMFGVLAAHERSLVETQDRLKACWARWTAPCGPLRRT